MGDVDIGKIKCSFYEVFLKVILTKCCTVEQEKQQFLKTHVNNSKKQPKDQQKHQKPLKPMQITAKTVRKAARNNTRILSPGRLSDKNITRHAPTQLRLARTHGTHETKTKTKQSDLPVMGER